MNTADKWYVHSGKSAYYVNDDKQQTEQACLFVLESGHVPLSSSCICHKVLKRNCFYQICDVSMCFQDNRHAEPRISVFRISSSFCSRWHHSAWKCSSMLCPASQQCPLGCLQNSALVCLAEHRSFPTLEGEMSAASFFHSSFLQAIITVILWPALQSSTKHICPARTQTRYACCACQSVCPFIPSDCMATAADPQKSWQLEIVHGCVPVRADDPRLFLPCNHYLPLVCSSHQLYIKSSFKE